MEGKHVSASFGARPGPPPRRITDEHTETRPTDYGAIGAEEDTVSDPAHDDRIGSDWAAEGGAVPDGPATRVGSTATTERDGTAQKGDPAQTDTPGQKRDTDQDPASDGSSPKVIPLPEITLDPPD